MKEIENPNIIDMLALVKEKVVSPILNEYGNVITINCSRPGLQASDIKYTKNVYGATCVGETLEDLQADEEALKQFMHTWRDQNVMKLVSIAATLNKEKLTEEDVAYLKRQLDYYVDSHKKVERIEVPVKCDAQSESHRGQYPHLFETLYALSDETLINLKNESLRKNQKEMYNASRKVLRSRGYRV